VPARSQIGIGFGIGFGIGYGKNDAAVRRMRTRLAKEK